MVDKPKPDHDMIRVVLEGLFIDRKIDYGTYCVLLEYVIDCDCLLDPTREDCNDKERR